MSMNDVSVDMYAGGLVFWRATMQPKDLLDALNQEIGVEVAWKELTQQRALERALSDYDGSIGASASTNLVRQAKPVMRNGICCCSCVVVSERKDDGGNLYEDSKRYWIDDEHNVWFVEQDGTDTLTHVNAKRYKGMVVGGCVSDGLNVVAKKLGGYQLRDNARIYYMPKATLQRWQQVASLVAAKTGMQFFTANCPADAETAAAVADNAVEILKERYEAILESIFEVENALNDSSLSARKNASLHDKRIRLETELENVKREAASIDASFRGLLDISTQVSNGIDEALALAVLATSN